MSDPLSIISGIAGVVTAGLQLSKGIHDILTVWRDAPEEMAEIATSIFELTVVLRELRRILKSGIDLYNRTLVRIIQSTMQRIGKMQKEIEELLNGAKKMGCLRWLFRRSQAKEILDRIEKNKTGINMILHVLSLAISTREISRSRSRRPKPEIDLEELEEERLLVRQQAEALTQVAYEGLTSSNRDEEEDEEEPPPHLLEGASRNQLRSLRRKASEARQKAMDASRWLFDLIFMPYIRTRSSSASGFEDGLVNFPSLDDNDEDSLVSAQRESSMRRLSISRPEVTSGVVKELLAHWTALNENEIEHIAYENDGIRIKVHEIQVEEYEEEVDVDEEEETSDDDDDDGLEVEEEIEDDVEDDATQTSQTASSHTLKESTKPREFFRSKSDKKGKERRKSKAENNVENETMSKRSHSSRRKPSSSFKMVKSWKVFSQLSKALDPKQKIKAAGSSLAGAATFGGAAAGAATRASMPIC